MSVSRLEGVKAWGTECTGPMRSTAAVRVSSERGLVTSMDTAETA